MVYRVVAEAGLESFQRHPKMHLDRRTEFIGRNFGVQVGSALEVPEFIDEVSYSLQLAVPDLLLAESWHLELRRAVEQVEDFGA